MSEQIPLRQGTCASVRPTLPTKAFGDGSPDYLDRHGLGSHLDLAWDLPGVAVRFTGIGLHFLPPTSSDGIGTGASGGLRHVDAYLGRVGGGHLSRPRCRSRPPRLS